MSAALWRGLLVVALTCGALAAGAASAGEIADLYEELVAGQPAAEDVAEAAPEPAPADVQRIAPERPPEAGVLRVGLERVPGLADGPRYWVILQSDGRFRYVGEANVDRLGEHTGTVPAGSAQILMAYVEEIGFRDMQVAYTSRFLDQPSSYLMAEWPDETKVVLNDAFSGPATLWGFGRLIDALLEQALWHE